MLSSSEQQVREQGQARRRRERGDVRDLRSGFPSATRCPATARARVSCVRHFAGSAASMAATKVACTAMVVAPPAPTRLVMAACCSWLSRLRSTSGGSARPATMRTPEGSVSARPGVLRAASAEAAGVEALARCLIGRAAWRPADAPRAGCAAMPRMARPCPAARFGHAAPRAAAAAASLAVASPSACLACAARACGALSLTSVRNLIGVTRESMRAHPLFERGMRGEPAAPSFLAHTASLPAKNMCATSAALLVLEPRAFRHSPP